VFGVCELLTGRAAFIVLGSILGTNMVANVWIRIVPAQEEAVRAIAAGRERDSLLAARAKRRATHNTYLMLPVLFIMVANHFPRAYSHHYNWLVLLFLIGIGAAVRHIMIMRDRGQSAQLAWATACCGVAAAVYLTSQAPRAVKT